MVSVASNEGQGKFLQYRSITGIRPRFVLRSRWLLNHVCIRGSVLRSNVVGTEVLNVCIVNRLHHDGLSGRVRKLQAHHSQHWLTDELVIIPVWGFDNRFWGLISGLSIKLSLV